LPEPPERSVRVGFAAGPFLPRAPSRGDPPLPGAARAGRAHLPRAARAQPAAGGDEVARDRRADRPRLLLRDELRRERIAYHSTSRRYVLNGGLDEETKQALRDLALG